MKFSLLSVHRADGDMIEGVWLQDHIGTLESATVAAQRTEAANSHRIDVAVVLQVNESTPPRFDVFRCQRLDTPRPIPSLLP